MRAGLRDERVAELLGASDQDLARIAELQPERGVEHVAGGEAKVDPASGLAEAVGEHVDEGRHIVVGDLLALLGCLDGEGGGADRLQLSLGGAVHLLAGGDLDLAPGLHLGLVRPNGTHLGRV